MRKLTMAIVVALTLAVAIPVLATPVVQLGYYTVAWKLPYEPTGNGADAPWPQTYADHVYTGNQPNLNAPLNLEDCGWYQVDVYHIASDRNVAKLTALLEAGVLNWPEDISIYVESKFVEVTECQQETTTTTEATTTSSIGETTTSQPLSTTSTVNQSSTSVTTTPSPSSTTTPESLPFTGVETWHYVLVILTLVGGGAGLVRWSHE